jgi:hypothetical protein
VKPKSAATAIVALVMAATLSACGSSSRSDTVSSAVANGGTTAPGGSASSSAVSTTTPESAAANGAIDACSLLTGAQASALTGQPFGAGVESVLSPGVEQCEYPYNGSGVAMDLIVYEPSSGITFSSLQSQLSGEGTVMQVSGVGDKAEFAGIDLDVMAGKYVFDVSAANGANGDTGAIAIAKQVVPELASK